MFLFIFGVVLSGVVGAAISYYYSNRKSASCLIREHKVLDPVEGEFPPEVKITFSGEEVKMLSEWKIFLWNSGNQTILGDDIAAGALVLKFENLRIVGTPIVLGSREVISPSAVREEGIIRLSFSYLDRGDSLGLTVYTSTPDYGDEKRDAEDYIYDVVIEGHIRGIPAGIKSKAEDDPVAYSDALTHFVISIFFIGVGYLALITTLNVGQSLDLWQIYGELSYKLVAKSTFLRWVQFLILPFVVLFSVGMTVYGVISVISALSSVPKFVRNNLR